MAHKKTLTRVASLFGPHLAAGAVVVGVPAHIAASGDLAGSALLITVTSAAMFVASPSFVWLAQRVRGNTLAVGSTILWIVSTVAAVSGAAAGWPIWALCLAQVLVIFVHQIITIAGRAISGGWGEQWVRRVGPLGRVGAALGAVISVAIVSGLSVAWLIVLVPFILVSPALHKPVDGHTISGQGWSWWVFSRNVLSAGLGYGSALLYVSFTAATAGPEWAGLAMVAYASGAVISPSIAARIPAVLHRGLAAWLVLGMLTSSAWFLVFIHPLGGVLTAMFLGGIFLFLAEGSADVEANRFRSHSAATAGRSFGTIGAGLVGTMLLAETGFITAPLAIYAAGAGFAAVIVLAGSGLLGARKRRKSVALAS